MAVFRFSPMFLQQGTLKAEPGQRAAIAKRRTDGTVSVHVCGIEFDVFPNVYDTGVDTELMAETVSVGPGQTFIEIGCGTGAVSLIVARRGAHGIGTDINPAAVKNARANAEKLGVNNISFHQGNVFEGVNGRFDAIICNPPYNNHVASDEVDRMFWDPEDGLKRRIFQEADAYIMPGGRLYFGWADFADLDSSLPYSLAAQNGWEPVHVASRPSKRGLHMFHVIEFKRAEEKAGP